MQGLSVEVWWCKSAEQQGQAAGESSTGEAVEDAGNGCSGHNNQSCTIKVGLPDKKNGSPLPDGLACLATAAAALTPAALAAAATAAAPSLAAAHAAAAAAPAAATPAAAGWPLLCAQKDGTCAAVLLSGGAPAACPAAPRARDGALGTASCLPGPLGRTPAVRGLHMRSQHASTARCECAHTQGRQGERAAWPAGTAARHDSGGSPSRRKSASLALSSTSSGTRRYLMVLPRT